MKKELEKWAQDAIKKYNSIAAKTNKSFYNQSPLYNVGDDVDVMIIGINPGSTGTYEQMLCNKAWTHKDERLSELPPEHIFNGNHMKDAKYNCSSWELHLSWKYFQGLLQYFSLVDTERNILLDESRYVLTNATFFDTKKAKELSSTLKETFICTIDLIKIIKPKMVLFLSGKEIFEQLGNLRKQDDSFEFEEITVDNKYFNIKDSAIHIGQLYGIPCYGVRHPAYKTTEAVIQISNFLKEVFGKPLMTADRYEDVICAEARKDIDYIMNAKDLKSRLDTFNKPKSVMSWIYDRYTPVVDIATQWNVKKKCYESKICNQGNIAIDLAPQKDSDTICVNMFCRYDKEEEAVSKLNELLSAIGITPNPMSDNVRRHIIGIYRYDDKESIINAVSDILQKIEASQL